MNHEIKTKHLSDGQTALLEEFAHDKAHTLTHGVYCFLHEKDYVEAIKVVGFMGAANVRQKIVKFEES